MSEHYHKYDPRRLMEWLSMYALILFGFPFGIYSAYLFQQTGELYYAGAFIAGFMVAFNQADRNVYYKRLGSLFHALDELEEVELNITRVEYTDYEVEVEGGN